MGVLCTDGDDEEGDGEDDDYIDDEDNYEKGDTSNIEIDVVVVLIVFIVGKSFSHVPLTPSGLVQGYPYRILCRMQ